AAAKDCERARGASAAPAFSGSGPDRRLVRPAFGGWLREVERRRVQKVRAEIDGRSSADAGAATRQPFPRLDPPCSVQVGQKTLVRLELAVAAEACRVAAGVDEVKTVPLQPGCPAAATGKPAKPRLLCRYDRR